MADNFPEHIIQMYQERLQNTYAMLTEICDSSKKIQPELYQKIKTEIHKIVGVSGYFEDIQVALDGRILDQLFKTNPSQNLLAANTRSLLIKFQKTLTHSLYFQH